MPEPRGRLRPVAGLARRARSPCVGQRSSRVRRRDRARRRGLPPARRRRDLPGRPGRPAGPRPRRLRRRRTCGPNHGPTDVDRHDHDPLLLRPPHLRRPGRGAVRPGRRRAAARSRRASARATGFREVTVRFPNLFYRASRAIRVEFTLPGGKPRSSSDIRVGSAFTTFTAWAWGDAGRSTVRIVLPTRLRRRRLRRRHRPAHATVTASS